MCIYARKRVVEEVYDRVSEVDLSTALELDPTTSLDSEVLVELESEDFKRGSVQAAVQRITELSREIQKDALYAEYKSKEGEIIVGYYQRARNEHIYVDLGKVEGLMPKSHQLPQDDYRQNDRIKSLVREVRKHPKSSVVQLILSRTDSAFVKELLAVEVPEIYDGIVEVAKIVREPGYRTKIAVTSRRDDVDPVGACVGPRGIRIRMVIKELNDEKIDVLEYSPDPVIFIKNALSPAEVLNVVVLDEEKRSALAIVAESQLSIAIGKQGLNVRLANRLVDWNIDVKTESQFEEMDVYTDTRRAAENLFDNDYQEESEFSSYVGFTPELIKILQDNGIQDVQTLVDLGEEGLRALEGMDEAHVQELLAAIEENFEVVEEGEEASVTSSPGTGGDEDQALQCPECGVRITTDMSECPHCGIGLSFEFEYEENEE